MLNSIQQPPRTWAALPVLFAGLVDWALQISEHVDGALLSGSGVLFLGREDGALEVWDLQDRSQEASLLAHPCARAVASLAFSPATIGPQTGGRPAQQLLAVGAAMFSPSPSLCVCVTE